MKYKKRIIVIVSFVIAIVFVLASCAKTDTSSSDETTGVVTDVSSTEDVSDEQKTADELTDGDYTFTDRDLSGTWDENEAVSVSLDGSTITSGSSEGITIDGSTLTLTDAGVFVLSGSLDDGKIIVNCADESAKVQIVFDGVTISNSTDSVIEIDAADKVFITLAPDTENTISDVSDTARDETNVDGAIFSMSDLTINGSGELTVNGNYKHAVVSKDDLVLCGGTYDITAVSDGFQGKDCVKVSSGVFNISSGSDGIVSNNDEDSAKGYVYIAGGTFVIDSSTDGIQAETVLDITGGTFTITTGGGSTNSSSGSDSWGMWGNSETTEDTSSAKGLKGGTYVYVKGGNYTIDSSDDAIHTNGTAEISDGSFMISSGDDGAHADTELTISGGTIDISNSYEGIESSAINIAGGTISVIASDDGFNAAGGNDSSSVDGRMGAGSFSTSTGSISITGGYIYVDASGDGIDSNGSISMADGVLLVSGPTDDGNGAFDYDSTCTITGGYAVICGSSGMAQTFSSDSSQYSLMYTATSSISGGTSVSITDSEGNVLLSMTPDKDYISIVVSTPEFANGSAYTITTGSTVSGADSHGYTNSGTASGGSELDTVTLDSVSTTAGASSGTGGMNGGGGMGNTNGGPSDMGGGMGR